MAFDNATTFNNELGSRSEVGDNTTAANGVGKRTLTENVPAIRTQASPTSIRTGGSLVATTTEGERITYAVVLPENLREQIRSVYAQYLKTGKVAYLDGVVFQVLQAGLKTAVPRLTPEQIEQDIQKGRTLTVDGDGSKERVLARLVGLSELPKWKKGLPARTSIGYLDISFSCKELEDLRQTTGEQPPPQIEPVTTLGGILNWGWGVIMGDFNEEADVGQTAVNMLLGLIPGVDQVLDVRDIVANLYFLIGQQRYDEFGPWFGLVITIIGAIPEFGSAIKGVVTIIRKVAKKIPIDDALSAAKVGIKLLEPELRRVLRGIADLGVSVAAKARTIVNSAMQAFERYMRITSWLSTKAKDYFAKLVERCQAVLSRLDSKVREAMSEVGARLKQLLDDILGVAKKEDLPTTKLPDADVPTVPKTRTAPTVPTSKSKPKPNETTVPMSRKPKIDEKTVPKDAPTVPKSKSDLADSEVPKSEKNWFDRKDPLKPDLDPAQFRNVTPTSFPGGAGSMSDVYKHKTITYPNGVEVPRWAMKVIGKGTDYDVLSPELASKLWSKVAGLNERASRVLGKDVIPNSSAFAPVKGADGVKYRPVLVQEFVDGVPMMSFGGVMQTEFQKQATRMLNELSSALQLPITRDYAQKVGWDKMQWWSIDSNPANFIVANVRDKGGNIIGHTLKWIDPFFPPSVGEVLANPKLLD